MLEEFQSHQRILYDLMVQYLEPMGGFYERLAYLAGLWNPSTSRYEHAALSAVYPAEHVHEALARCHEEIFERLLESPLASQEEDLACYFESLPGAQVLSAQQRKQIMQSWIPLQAPDYLKELFCSNQTALCELLQATQTRARSDS